MRKAREFTWRGRGAGQSRWRCARAHGGGPSDRASGQRQPSGVMLQAMLTTASASELVLRVLLLFGYALLFAAVEIEIEGSHGWAERLPPWFRITPWYARLYGLLMRGKPLTG